MMVSSRTGTKGDRIKIAYDKHRLDEESQGHTFTLDGSFIRSLYIKQVIKQTNMS